MIKLAEQEWQAAPISQIKDKFNNERNSDNLSDSFFKLLASLKSTSENNIRSLLETQTELNKEITKQNFESKILDLNLKLKEKESKINKCKEKRQQIEKERTEGIK